MQDTALNDTLDVLVKALCRDYQRREGIIRSAVAERRVDNELRYLNYKIFTAVSEIVGEAHAPIYIEEIGNSVGYAKSKLYSYSEGLYKHYKWLVKKNIARHLHLM
jgi:hypothetical protein